MFFELLDGGHDPRAINYKELASDWTRHNILKKYELDCLEIEWLKKTIGFFCLNAKTIWKKHRGKVTGLNVQKQHAKFFDKYIDATNLSPCTCAKCFPLETRNVEVSDDDLLHCKYCDDEFCTEKDLVAHENEFHQISSQRKTIIEE